MALGEQQLPKPVHFFVVFVFVILFVLGCVEDGVRHAICLQAGDRSKILPSPQSRQPCHDRSEQKTIASSQPPAKTPEIMCSQNN